jgi:light-regulated signal transduction histidine kinase (bacteriophytochrome)
VILRTQELHEIQPKKEAQTEQALLILMQRCGGCDINAEDRSSHLIRFDMKIKSMGIGLRSQNTGALFIDFGSLKDGTKYLPNSLELSLSRMLIEQMGGKVRLNSRGTNFTISFITACDIRERDAI